VKPIRCSQVEIRDTKRVNMSLAMTERDTPSERSHSILEVTMDTDRGRWGYIVLERNWVLEMGQG